jgi:hypothetical protein
MNEHLSAEGSDILLLPFLQARNDSAAEDLLTCLIHEHADPIIAKILKSKLRVSLNGSHGSHDNQDALEIVSELHATLIADLRAVQKHPSQKTITSFRDYVAVKTYSACADYFRERNPNRRRLKNLLRYQLKQNPEFELWKAEDNCWYAGLSRWDGTKDTDNSSAPAVSAGDIREKFPMIHAQDIPPAELLNAVFDRVGRAVEFDRVVTLAAEVWNISDAPFESVDKADPEQPDKQPGVGVDILLEQRLYLETLWSEVCQLPLLQRVALLLNLRDAQGGSAIFFIPYLGIASQQKIAEILGIEAQAFSKLWSDLPLDDSRIASKLDISRQQVINLRKTARERLARRMEKPATMEPQGHPKNSKKRR